MPDLTTIRGWLYHPAVPTYEKVRRLVTERHLGADAPYPHVWVLPLDPDQFWDYTFLGGDVRTVFLPELRDTIRTIAETVVMPGDYPPHCVEGYFRWDADTGESGEWTCSRGRFVERSLPPSCDWALDPYPDVPGGPSSE